MTSFLFSSKVRDVCDDEPIRALRVTAEGCPRKQRYLEAVAAARRAESDVLPDPATSHSTTKCGWMAAPRSWRSARRPSWSIPRRAAYRPWHRPGGTRGPHSRAGRACPASTSGGALMDRSSGACGERCVTRGLPYLPDFYSNNFLNLQTPTIW